LTSKIDAGLELISALGARITQEASSLQFEKPKIVKQEERGTCRYCKKKLSTGYYVVFKSHTYGPYGSSCIRKMYLDYLLLIEGHSY